MARQRCSSQGPLTKAYPQRYVEEAERSDGTPMTARTHQAVSQTDHFRVCLWNGGVVWRRQRCSSQGPLTKAYPQRYVEEAERSDGTPMTARTHQAVSQTDHLKLLEEVARRELILAALPQRWP